MHPIPCAELRIRDLEELISAAESEGNDAEVSRLGELLGQAEDDLDEVLRATVERMGEESDMEDGEGFDDGDDDAGHDDYENSDEEGEEEETEVVGGKVVNGAAAERRPPPKDNGDGVQFAPPPPPQSSRESLQYPIS